MAAIVQGNRIDLARLIGGEIFDGEDAAVRADLADDLLGDVAMVESFRFVGRKLAQEFGEVLLDPLTANAGHRAVGEMGAVRKGVRLRVPFFENGAMMGVDGEAVFREFGSEMRYVVPAFRAEIAQGGREASDHRRDRDGEVADLGFAAGVFGEEVLVEFERAARVEFEAGGSLVGGIVGDHRSAVSTETDGAWYDNAERGHGGDCGVGCVATGGEHLARSLGGERVMSCNRGVLRA